MLSYFLHTFAAKQHKETFSLGKKEDDDKKSPLLARPDKNCFPVLCSNSTFLRQLRGHIKVQIQNEF